MSLSILNLSFSLNTTNHFQKEDVNLGIDDSDISISDTILSEDYYHYSFENEINKFRLNHQKDDFAVQLLNCIKDQHFEYGINSQADLLVQKQLNINMLATENTLNELFVNNFDIPHVIIGILQIISRLSEPSIISKGQVMAIAALSHKNLEVRDCGIRCFECWANESSLRILKCIKTEPKWLQEYIENVITYIEEELCHIL